MPESMDARPWPGTLGVCMSSDEASSHYNLRASSDVNAICLCTFGIQQSLHSWL